MVNTLTPTAMPKRRAPSPVPSESSLSSHVLPVASTSTLRQSKRRKVQPEIEVEPSQKKVKSPFKALRKKTLKARLAATMNIQVTTKGKEKQEPAPPTPDSLAESIELPSNKVEEEIEMLRKQLSEKDAVCHAATGLPASIADTGHSKLKRNNNL